MIKRRFATILASVFAGNTALFATQAIATQKIQPQEQKADQYMIINLASITLAQAQNDADAENPVDTQLAETELSSPYYLSLSSFDTTKVARFGNLDELESSFAQNAADSTGTLEYAVTDIRAGEPMISYLLDQYTEYATYSAVEFCEVVSLQPTNELGLHELLLQLEEGANIVHYGTGMLLDGSPEELKKTQEATYVNKFGDPAFRLESMTNHWLIVHLIPDMPVSEALEAEQLSQAETDEAASQSLEEKVDETTSQDVAKADPTKPSEKSSSESATKPTTKAPETTKPASTKPTQPTKAPETAATVAPTAAHTHN